MTSKIDSKPVDIPQGFDVIKETEESFYRNHKWRVLFSLIETDESLSISDMARKTKMNTQEVEQALESMELIGFIRKSDIGYKQIKSYFKRSKMSYSDDVDLMTQHVLSCAQNSNRLLETAHSSNQKKCRTLTYNSNKKLVEEFATAIERALSEFKSKSDVTPAKEWDNVYSICFSIVDMIDN